MALDNYLNSIYWKSVSINGIDTKYKISNTSILRLGDKIIEEPYIYIDNKAFKVDKAYLAAIAFLNNPYGYQSIRKDGKIEWYLNKDLIKEAIDTELVYYYTKKHMDSSEENRVRKACELMSNPEFRLTYVSDITNISREELYDIRMGNKWNDISREYIFPIRNHLVSDSSYTLSQIHEVCKMLSSIKSFKQALIQRITGVKPYTIDLIRYRKAYQMIGMFYEFCPIDHTHTHDLNLYTSQQIRHACFMLENPKYSYKMISEFCNINIDVLYKIRDRKLFTDISKDFNTQDNRIFNNIPYVSRIIELIQSGKPTPEIISMIQIEYNISNKKDIINSLNEIKRKYFDVNSSTTIPNGE